MLKLYLKKLPNKKFRSIILSLVILIVLLSNSISISTGLIIGNELGRFENCFAIAIEIGENDKFAYVADLDEGLVVLDIQKAKHPSEKSRLYHSGRAHDISLQEEVIFLAVNEAGLDIINVSNPLIPVRLSNYNNSKLIFRVSVCDDFAIISSQNNQGLENAFSILNISDLTSPYLISLKPVNDIVYKALIVENTLYVAENYDGISCYDIKNISSPVFISRWDDGGRYVDISFNNQKLSACDTNFGLRILNVSDPFNISEIGSVKSIGEYWSSFFENDIIYTIDHPNGFAIVDVNNASNPSLQNTISTAGDSCEIFVQNEIAYIADGEMGVTIIDLSSSWIKQVFYQYPWVFPVGFGGFVLLVVILIWIRKRLKSSRNH